VGWSALLHDISVVKYRDSSILHPKNGAAEADLYLKKMGLPGNVISAIKHCIYEHGRLGDPRSLEARIVRAADNMADIETFFDIIFTFCSLKSRIHTGYDRVKGLKEGHYWVGDKLAHTMDKLSDFEYARQIIQPKLAAAQLVHASMSPYLDIRDKIFDPKTTLEAFFEVIFKSCMDEALKDGGYDAEQGLRGGFDNAEKRLFFAWLSLSKAQQMKHQELYDAEHLILGSIHQYLDK
jgi:hypothetical protein